MQLITLLFSAALASAMVMPDRVAMANRAVNTPTPPQKASWAVNVWPAAGCAKGGSTMKHIASTQTRGTSTCYNVAQSPTTFGSANIALTGNCKITYYSDTACQTPSSIQANGAGTCTTFTQGQVATFGVQC